MRISAYRNIVLLLLAFFQVAAFPRPALAEEIKKCVYCKGEIDENERVYVQTRNRQTFKKAYYHDVCLEECENGAGVECGNCLLDYRTSDVVEIKGTPICRECSRFSISNQAQIEKILYDIRLLLHQKIGIGTHHTPHLEIITAKEMAGYAGPDAMGFIVPHIIRKKNNEIPYSRVVSIICIMAGMSREVYTEVIAHEWGHAWHYEQFGERPSKELVEGFAEWVSYKACQLLRYQNITDYFDYACTRQRFKGVYVTGLRIYLEVEKKYGIKGVLEYARNEVERT